MPSAVEISPLLALPETAHWADYIAIDIPRAAIPEMLMPIYQFINSGYAQVFIETLIPCGGIGECGLCAVSLRKGYKLACKDGPVFDLKSIPG